MRWILLFIVLLVTGCYRDASGKKLPATAPAVVTAAVTTRPAMSVSQKVEYLIDSIGQLEGATFIRNDGEYSAANAAALMRYRWNRDKDKLKTAEEFVQELATKSSTTGKPYVIRFKDGRQVNSGDYLLGKLAELDKAATSQPDGRMPRQ